MASSTSTDSTPPVPHLSILFVCLGNICRSPMAEGVFRAILTTRPHEAGTYIIPSTSIDSAGTGAYHVGSLPDPRTTAVLAAHSIADYTHSARKVRLQDFEDFDFIFAMDGGNLEDLMEVRELVLGARAKRNGQRVNSLSSRNTAFEPEETRPLTAIPDHLRDVKVGKAQDGLAQVMLFGAFSGRDAQEEVGDPYYDDGRGGFETAYEQVSRFSRGFLTWLDAVTSAGT